MKTYSLSHVSDGALLRDLTTLVAKERGITAAVLAHLAEVDARKLYLPAAHPSMYSYCVHELGLSEDAALKRIRVARTARLYPAIFAALADGRLHLSTVILLTPHLTTENADELLAAAAHQSKTAIEHLLAQRFPRPDLLGPIEALPPSPSACQLIPGTVDMHGFGKGELAPGPVAALASGRVVDAAATGHADQLAPGPVEALAPRPLTLRVAIAPSTHQKLRYAQALLSHAVPSGDLAQVLDRALDALVVQLEKRKFAATSRPRACQQRSTRHRHIPAAVRRAVWHRDQGQCTFVSERGQRCPARKFLEFDHIDEIAREGEGTVERMRLRCRAHNQFTAERTFGARFMAGKREAAQLAAAERRMRAAEQRAAVETQALAAAQDPATDVIPWLRSLGFRADEARRGATACASMPDASLEARVRVALRCLAPNRARRGAAAS